ncbi:MAG: hypothetical protein ACYTF0_05540 [Planctomycetota bacterium]|jgi:hypothetical protein
MSLYLHCIQGPQQGRDLHLDREEPLRFSLTQAGQAVGELAFACAAKGLRFVNDSPVESAVNGTDSHEAVLMCGDRVQVGPMVFEVRAAEDIDQTPPFGALVGRAPAPAAAAKEADASSSRSSRRLSASHASVVESTDDRRGLLGKMGSVFKRGGKEERPADLERLEEQRDNLLRAAGYRALTAQGGMGLPMGVLAQLQAGERVVIDPEDLNRPLFESFCLQVEQLRLLDAGVVAKCKRFGIDADPVLQAAAMPLREEREERELEAFNEMDGLGTEDLTLGSGPNRIPDGAIAAAAGGAQETDAYARELSPQPDDSARTPSDRRRTSEGGGSDRRRTSEGGGGGRRRRRRR